MSINDLCNHSQEVIYLLSTPLFLFVFVSIGVGFALGVWRTRRSHDETTFKSNMPKNYYLALAQLLNDEQDQAINSFIANMEINIHTLDIHLALGGLLRRKGEFTRAIRIHQNLLAQRSLSIDQIKKVQMELAIDYLKSGLYDRAEQLLKDFVNHGGKNKTELHTALKYLLDVYESTKEWKMAIDVADRLTTRKFAITIDEWREKQSHYCCELALESVNSDIFTARNWIKSALKYDKKNVRATLIQAEVDIKQNKFSDAIRNLEKIPKQNSKFISEMLEPLHRCYFDSEKEHILFDYFYSLYQENKSLLLLQHLVKSKAVDSWNEDFFQFLLNELTEYSDTEVAGRLLVMVNQKGVFNDFNEHDLTSFLESFVNLKSRYLCDSCGYSGNEIHWSCPSCKSWNKMSLQ